jgi:hypothetical protein
MQHTMQLTWFAIENERRSQQIVTRGDGAICVENIGAHERRRRMWGGVFGAALTLLIAVALLAGGADRAWRLILFLPAAMSAFGFFQAHERT